MQTITLVAGEKGGVGKSPVALALCARYAAQSRPLVVCEADRSNGDVGRACENKAGYTVCYPYFTEDSDHTDKADALLDAVLTQGTDGVVNCPAQSYRSMVKWINQGSADLAIEEGIQLRFLFVTNGEYDSMTLFLQSLEEFPLIPHILVRNTYFTDRLTYDYSDQERNPTVKEAIQKHRVPVITFPRFAPSDLDFIKSRCLTFSEAIASGSGLTIAARSRVQRALSVFITQLEKLEVDNHANPTEGTESRGTRKSIAGEKRSGKKKSLGDSIEDTDTAG